MPDINPIHWLLIVLAALLAVLWGAYSFQGHQFELEKARHAAFVAETKAVGLVQEREGKELNLKHEQSKKEADNEINIARGNIAFYANQLRVAAKNSRGSLLPATAASAGSPQGTCFDSSELERGVARYSDGMDGLRGRATEIAIKGAQAVADLDGVKEWAQIK